MNNEIYVKIENVFGGLYLVLKDYDDEIIVAYPIENDKVSLEALKYISLHLDGFDIHWCLS